MFPDESYVVNVMSPIPLMGTVTRKQFKDGQQEYWFTPDPRILAGFRKTFSVPECDLELYGRPSRARIEEINRKLAEEMRSASRLQLDAELRPNWESNVLPWPEDRKSADNAAE